MSNKSNTSRNRSSFSHLNDNASTAIVRGSASNHISHGTAGGNAAASTFNAPRVFNRTAERRDSTARVELGASRAADNDAPYEAAIIRIGVLSTPTLRLRNTSPDIVRSLLTG